MSIFIGFLTVVLVLDCAFLVLLVLLQLPKKEAGMGTAFGGGATDVLFGAGTGNVLTKATAYSAGIFLGLCLILAILQNRQHRNAGGAIGKALAAPVVSPAPQAPAATPAPTTATSMVPLTVSPPTTTTAPAAPAEGAATPPAPAPSAPVEPKK